MSADTHEVTEPLVELAPDESVLAALTQSAHPVEFIEANAADESAAPEQS
jgi:hypothetical protein